MTKPCVPFSFSEAARRTITLIGVGEAVRLMSVSKSTLDAWADHDNPRLPRIDQGCVLDLAYTAAGGDGSPFLDAFAHQVDVDIANRDACRIALSEDVATFAKDSGEMVAAILAVTQSNASPREIHRAMVEAQDVGRSADAVVRSLKPFFHRGAGPRSGKAGGTQ